MAAFKKSESTVLHISHEAMAAAGSMTKKTGFSASYSKKMGQTANSGW